MKTQRRLFSLATRTNTENGIDRIKFATLVGTIGGVFWSMIGYAFYLMNFSKIGPSVIVSPMFAEETATKPIAQFVGIAVFAALSILFSILYVFLFSKYYTPWIGVVSGALLFVLFFYGVNPLLQLTDEPLLQIGINTFTTMLCLFVLYGLFIGFSLSAEYSGKEDEAK